MRIPLIRRQQKSDSTQPENGNGKDGKGKDSKSKEVPRLGKDGQKATLPASSPDKDEDGGQYVIGTNKKIPLPGKGPNQGAPLWQSPAAVETTPVTPTFSFKHEEKQPAEASFVAKVVVPESQPEPLDVTQEPQADVGETTAVPMEPFEEEADKHAVEATVAAGTPLPELPSEQHEVTEPSAATTVEKTPPPQSPPHDGQLRHVAETVSAKGTEDAMAILKAMPDYIFRIGPGGVVPVVGNGSGFCVGAALGHPPDGEAAAEQAEKLELLEKMLIEELGRQSEPHARKVLETKQLQTFEFQLRGDKDAHHVEVRLTPFGQSEVLALVRDITDKVQRHNALIESRNELENHLKERNAELMRVNKMLKTEVELREEQEDVLKKNFRRLESLVDETIGAITLIVERKDPHVADHQRRVCLLACAIAQEMNSRNDRMRAVRMAAQLHDLGKTFIPAEILRKPGKLTDAEMSMVKTHPDTDYQILKQINFPISIADVVRQHHERLDGSGYPQGLKGDAILIEARIIAVADVIEGMIFERPYRVAPGLEAALKEIADNKGTLYDPAVADACLKLFAEKRFRFESMPVQVQENAVSVGPASDHRDL
jgi:HD-GYP domain-containing protein (c-di-GMP phosphodiesterase class II)